MQKVEWEGANKLEINEILEMAADGYTFCIEDGRICSVEIQLAMAA